ncbi:winged helix-turn-helix domain-containing tetratricopeptide repeat protein [Labrys okinawensis]|uniref:winged helix-turn-helix domain-containing tetratricopeptide repeat protein n=1 Tax=Labrys okinawensis TaxID=346911 RepID=UPI0039BC6218
MEQELTYRLGESVFNVSRGTLYRAGELVLPRPKTFQLLAYLARNPGRVVGKDELLDVVWPSTTVTDDSLTQCIRDARKCIGDEQQQIIRTMPRRGYMFQPSGTLAEGPASAELPVGLERRQAEPRIAVFPFRGQALEEPLKSAFDAVAEEITTALSYFRTLSVLERYSTLALARTEPDGMQVALQEAGVDFMVEGRIDGGDPLFNVVITLSDTRSARRLWTQAFSFEADALFDFHQTVARRIASALVFNIESAAAYRVAPAPARNVEAYTHLMQALLLLRAHGEEAVGQARAHLWKAIALDPQSGLAFAYLAWTDAVQNGYGRTSPELLDPALDNALRGVSLSPFEARCHRILGLILMLRHDFLAADLHHRQALELNPYDADTIAQMGWLKAIMGNPAAGLELVDWAMQLNPVHPPWYYLDRGVVQLLLGRHGEAAETLSRLPLGDVNRWALLSVCQALQDDMKGAAASVRQARELEPGLTAAMVQHVTMQEGGADNAWLRVALEKAGWS